MVRVFQLALWMGTLGAVLAQVPPPALHPHFDLRTRRFDVDVDGAPNAYGPRGKRTLDVLSHAHYRGWKNGPIVGYLTDDDHPRIPVVQGPHDPYPGYYISQTSFTDPARTRADDPLRYVDAAQINYVVRGREAKRRAVRMGDFVAVHSARTGRTVFGVVADEGNPSGDEGSLHLLQDLGYRYHGGRDEGVDRPGEITVRFFPGSNPGHRFFRTEAALDAAAEALGLDRNFAQPVRVGKHPSQHESNSLMPSGELLKPDGLHGRFSCSTALLAAPASKFPNCASAPAPSVDRTSSSRRGARRRTRKPPT